MKQVLVFLVMLTGFSAAQNFSVSTLEVFTQSGKAFNVNPVKVTSDEGNPLLMFYLINSSLKPRIEVLMDIDFTASFDYSLVCASRNVSFLLKVAVSDRQNLVINGISDFRISCENAEESEIEVIPGKEFGSNENVETEPETVLRKIYIADGSIDVQMQSGIIGYSDVTFSIQTVNSDSVNTTSYSDSGTSPSARNASSFIILDPETSYKTLTYTISIVRKVRPVDKLFRLIVYAVQIFVATGFGAKLDLQLVKENLWRPVAPGIGLVCQYLLMPLIAFGASSAVSGEMPTVALGIFLAGCCPGGGASNTYTYLLKGDLSLSITMTALSTIAAIAMLPFWLYTLGRVFIDDDLNIPFEMVAVSLSVLILPLVGGIFLKQKFPKAADRLQKLLKPVIVIMALILIIVGVLANLYIFRLFKPSIIAAACLLPYVGYICGGVVAAIFRQPWKKIKTISIETGMQNTSIAYILLINSFPAPSGDIAAVAPVASAVMTPLPPFLVTVCYLSFQYFKKRRGNKAEKYKCNNDEEAVTTDGADETLMTEMTSTKEKEMSKNIETTPVEAEKVITSSKNLESKNENVENDSNPAEDGQTIVNKNSET